MRLGRIASPDGVAFVAIEGQDADAIVREIAEHPFGTPTFTGRQWPLADVRLLAPILASKVVCIGKNYAAHIAEMGRDTPAYPTLFAKYAEALVGAYDDIVLPSASDAVDWEAELAVVIGAPARHIDESAAELAIAGYEQAREPKKIIIMPGGHFDAYVKGFEAASGPARDWFVQHLAP